MKRGSGGGLVEGFGLGTPAGLDVGGFGAAGSAEGSGSGALGGPERVGDAAGSRGLGGDVEEDAAVAGGGLVSRLIGTAEGGTRNDLLLGSSTLSMPWMLMSLSEELCWSGYLELDPATEVSPATGVQAPTESRPT